MSELTIKFFLKHYFIYTRKRCFKYLVKPHLHSSSLLQKKIQFERHNQNVTFRLIYFMFDSFFFVLIFNANKKIFKIYFHTKSRKFCLLI